MAPTWLTTVAWFYLGVCFVCTAAITYDIFFNRRRQPMGVMDAVYPITALYFGPFALALYWRWARSPARPATVPKPTSGSAHPRWRWRARWQLQPLDTTTCTPTRSPGGCRWRSR